jgi:hypothetical protein
VSVDPHRADSVHRHRHSDGHSHGHADGHGHARAAGDAPAASPLWWSAQQRLLGAALLAVVLWLVIAWAVA